MIGGTWLCDYPMVGSHTFVSVLCFTALQTCVAQDLQSATFAACTVEISAPQSAPSIFILSQQKNQSTVEKFVETELQTNVHRRPARHPQLACKSDFHPDFTAMMEGRLCWNMILSAKLLCAGTFVQRVFIGCASATPAAALTVGSNGANPEPH
eukprot:365627-Pelagomonas_calceolata.AAC.2